MVNSRFRGMLPLALLGMLLLASCSSYPAFEEAYKALETDAAVRYTRQKSWHEFWPVAEQQAVGLIYYPGGLVEAEAYAPLCRELAAAGYPTVLVVMPFNLAVFDTDAALQVQKYYRSSPVRSWVLLGHSLGGAMGSSFIHKHPDAVDGLVLMGSYPPDSADMSGVPIKALSIYAEFNHKSNEDEQLAKRPLMPQDTEYYEILGGNHAQFGYYGPQKGDGEATIPLRAQQDATVARILEFLARF